MAHFAKIGMNGKVIQVLTLADNDMLDANNQPDEKVGQQYLEKHNNWPSQMWIKTSYNTFQNGGTNRLKKLSQLIKSTKKTNRQKDLSNSYDIYDISEKNAKILFSIRDETWETDKYYINRGEEIYISQLVAHLFVLY